MNMLNSQSKESMETTERVRVIVTDLYLGGRTKEGLNDLYNTDS